MVILAVTAALMAVAGIAVWLAGLRWSAARHAPRIAPARVHALVTRHPRLAAFLRLQVDPASATGVALFGAVILLVAGAVTFGVLLVVVRENLGLASADLAVAHFAAHHASSLSTRVLRALSQLGGAVVLSVLCVVAVMLEARRGRVLAVAGFLVLCVGGQLVVVDMVKALVERVRPNVDRLASFSGSSFPSGHTTAAAAAFAAFALLAGIGRSRRAKAAFAGIAVSVAVGVGCTRAFLGVHWLSDVLAGLALGWGWFALCSIAFGGRLLRFGAPIEQAELVAVSADSHHDDRRPSPATSPAPSRGPSLG